MSIFFYHHRPDPDTPLAETAHALDLLVRQGKALYVGVSNYSAEQTKEIAKILKDQGTPLSSINLATICLIVGSKMD